MTTERTEHPEAQARPRRSRRRPALVAGGVALLLAVGAGAGWTAVTVHGADRDPGAATWRLAKPSAGKPAKGGDGLSAMLLPYGDEYGRGPDLDEFGSDAELSGRQATALRRRSMADLPRSQRRLLERRLDRNPVKGMAMRSYLSSAQFTEDEAASGEVFALEIVLTRMDQRSVRSMTAYQHEFAEAMKIFRKGPAVEGHENTACFLPPTDSGEKLDMMVCSGYVGDVLVSATATAAKPLDKKGVAQMVAAQLDRIKDPGKAV
ncbi:hypothetical protein JK359_07210 [Streptomyces actinomycinicus]|uniref:Secreted protein n=1 Tax=Streptomyces actinomycinicus TaxID=1695166 RepID=A0A937EFE1_9ACTN|nr:hypothetical protein [Streptomyces actinomycinicus]MBL1081771.1 hypothetical protein [Streptomyces actinomycinicus]